MLTKMTGEDWVLVLAVFDACRSRRGDKGRDGRKFLAALQMMGKIKRFKRIALRCEKTARTYASFLALVYGFISIKSVHTA